MFFFKNQSSNIFDNLILETSNSIFNTREEYNNVLANSKVFVKSSNNIYSTDIRKSINKDIAFCSYMLNTLIDKLSKFISSFNEWIDLIKNAIEILNSDKYLSKYHEELFNFFSQYIVFDRSLFKKETGFSGDTVSKILNKLFDHNLIEYKNIVRTRNSKKMSFIPFNYFLNR